MIAGDVIHTHGFWRVVELGDQFRFETLLGRDLTDSRYTVEMICQDLASDLWGTTGGQWGQVGDTVFAGRASAGAEWRFWVIDGVDFTGKPTMRSLTFSELQRLAQALAQLVSAEG